MNYDKRKKIIKRCKYIVIACLALIVAIALIGGGSDDKKADDLTSRLGAYAAGNVSESEIINRFKDEYGEDKVKKAYKEYIKDVPLNFNSRAYGRAKDLLDAGAAPEDLNKLLLQAGFTDEQVQTAIDRINEKVLN